MSETHRRVLPQKSEERKQCSCGVMFSPRASGEAQTHCSARCRKLSAERKYRRSAKGLVAQRSRGARATARLRQIKTRPCMDCGKTFPPECMDFDHRDPSTKLFQVGARRNNGPTLMAEVAKCDVVCANCHRTRTKRWRDAQAIAS